MYIPFSKKNDIINIFIKCVVIIYLTFCGYIAPDFKYITELIQTIALNKVMSRIPSAPSLWSIL